jgi:hypothetical protein
LLPLFASGVVDIVDKFTDGVVDTGVGVVLLIPLVHLDLQISPRIFRKI